MHNLRKQVFVICSIWPSFQNVRPKKGIILHLFVGHCKTPFHGFIKNVDLSSFLYYLENSLMFQSKQFLLWFKRSKISCRKKMTTHKIFDINFVKQRKMRKPFSRRFSLEFFSFKMGYKIDIKFCVWSFACGKRFYC